MAKDLSDENLPSELIVGLPPEIFTSAPTSESRLAAEIFLPGWWDLTPREQQVAVLVCLKFTNSQMALLLTVSPETIKTHVEHILRKLGLRCKAEVRYTLRKAITRRARGIR